MTMLVSPHPPLFSFATEPELARARYLFEFFILVLRCPTSFSRLISPVSQAFSSCLLGKRISRPLVSCPSKVKVCHLWPLDAQIAGLAQNSSCKSSHLSPRLNLKDLLHPCFFLICTLFAHPNSFCQSLSGYGRELFFHFKAKRFSEVVPFLPAAAATCLFNFNLSVGSHLHCMRSPGTIPVLNNFLTPTFM